MSTDPYIDAFWLKSRVMRALFYDRRSRTMIVQTAHGKFLIYRDIDQQLTQALAAHTAPGMLYEQSLRAALKPKLAKMTPANFMLLRRVRKIAKAGSEAAASEAAPDDHADRRPDAGR
jgi:hypothetical protein